MYKHEVEQYQFYKMPKWLFKEPYSKLSVNAKIMYMLMFDRLALSIKNKWYDDDGKLYQYFTNEQLIGKLNFTEKTAIKSKKELKKIGLLSEVRQGINKPNRLYINGTGKITGQELENLQHGTGKFTGQELENLQGIKTEYIKTELSRLSIDDVAASSGAFSLKDFFDNYENETGRMMSPFEIEDFTKWEKEDGMSAEIMNLALKEAVLNKKLSFKYINSILLNWKRQNLTSRKAVENYLEEFEQRKSGSYSKTPQQTNVPEWSNPDYKAPDLDSLKVEVTEDYSDDPTAF
ncbi:DnaD domain protein [Streptococcus jiangjianxini]|uniref:DnaD domain protein n=1 Tax=Streptococcus jiangjianxini TaxID=3161189 RepID=UPI0032ED9D7A